MIRIWAKIIIDNKLVKDLIYEATENYNREEFFDHLTEICYRLNISTPTLLDAHFDNYENFNNIKFLPRDFVEPISFDKLELENASR